MRGFLDEFPSENLGSNQVYDELVGKYFCFGRNSFSVICLFPDIWGISRHFTGPESPQLGATVRGTMPKRLRNCPSMYFLWFVKDF